MGEERPFMEAREALDHDDEPLKDIQREGMIEDIGGRASGRPTLFIIGGVVLVLLLIIAGLFLPPISLAERLGLTGAGAGIGEQAIEGEIALSLSDQEAEAGVTRLAKADFLSGNVAAEWTTAAGAMPAGLTLASNVYAIDYRDEAPQGYATIAVPAEAQPVQTVDLYAWDGQIWRFMPGTMSGDGSQLTSAAGPLPRAMALMQTAAASPPEISAELLPTQSFPPPVLPHLTEVSVGTLTLGQNGALMGEVSPAPQGAYRQLLRVTNTGAIVDTLSLSGLLGDPALQEQHIQALVAAVQGGSFHGLNLDYQGVPADHRAAFSAFVTNLAGALQAQDLQLVVSLATPQMAGDSWDTGGQDWAAIGAAADAVYAQMPLDPTVYDDNDLAEKILAWAVRQVDRSKLSMLVSTNAVDSVSGSHLEIANSQALQNFGELSLVRGAAEVVPGTAIEVALSGSASDLAWDPDGLTYRYTYVQSGQEHDVWLSNEAMLSHRSRLANRYHLRGLAMRGLGTVVEGAGYAAALERFIQAAEALEPASAAIVWAVEDESGGVVSSSSGEALTYAWDAAAEPGTYTIKADFAQGDNVANLGSLDVIVQVPPTPTPTPTPEPTATPEAEPTAVAAPAGAPPPAANPGDADAVANTPANVRNGPGLSYGKIAGLNTGDRVSLIGRNEAADWLQIQMADGTEGWVFAQLLTVNSAINVSSLAVIEVEPPSGGTTAGDGGGAPPPVIPPAGGGSFELGGQTHGLANPSLMQMSGMKWVKFQHKWGPGDSPDAVAGRIQQAHANGLKVLLSIPGANTYPSSIDFSGYVSFLGGVAALGPDAIEIWNEMNIDFEWPAGQIDPSSYVNNMLAPAYNAIKAANPNVMVVSGAPAPTGFDNGTNAWADDRYMAGVAAAGGASYMDCIGVHYNAGATSPSATSGHPAGGLHYSWYFWGTLNMYYNSFGGARPVCFTELGYLSGQDFGGVPSRFSWAANTTVAQHAQWLAEAVSLSANSGKVRMLIIFNVDFTHWGDDPQAGYAMLRPDGSCPSCDLLRQVMGG
jgi:hypothetical protein